MWYHIFMSETQQHIPEESLSPEPLSTTSRLEDIIKVAPEYSDKIHRYESQITPLSPEEQSTLIEKWQREVSAGTANMWVFWRLIREFRTKERQEERNQKQGKETQVQDKETQVEGKETQKQEKGKKWIQEDTEIKNNADRINKAAESALKSWEKIQGVTGDAYTSEINARIQKDKSEIQNPDSEIGKLLSSMGIDGAKAQSSPEVERIISARAMTQVYIANQNTILEKHPELKTEIREFEGYRFDLWIQESIQAKNVNKLLSDIPRDTRWQIVDTVTSLTASKPETPVTRTGDTLRFADPQNEKYQYEIDMGKQPPRLAKSLNWLSISRNVEPLSEGKKELGKLEWETQKLTEAVNSQKASESIDIIAWVDTSLLDEQTKDGKNPKEKQSLEQYLSTKKYLAKSLKEGNSTERLQAIQKMKEANNSLEETRRNMINPENMDNPQQGNLEQSLWKEQEALTYLGTLYQQLVDKTGQIRLLKEQTKNEWSNEDFEKNALYNLNFLSYVGYDSLGQDNMERIIRSLNSPNNPRQSEIGEIDLNRKLDTPKTQALTLAIANLVRNGRTTTWWTWAEMSKWEKSQQSWDGVDKTDPIIAARQTQSAGFREALIGVKNNLTQEWWSLKTNSQLETVLYGKDRDWEVNNSAINTIGWEWNTSFA